MKQVWLSRLRMVAGYLLGWVVRLWALTWRVQTIRVEAGKELAESPRVYAFWHGHQMGLLAARRPRRLVTLVSLSKDGQLQAGTMRALGLTVVRGSSSRAASRGLLGVVRLVRRGASAAFAVDGPKGPLRRAKPGAALVVAKTGALLTPVAMVARRSIVLAAWDEFEIPLPFTRVVVVIGADTASTARDGWDAQLSQAIESARQRARCELQKTPAIAPKALPSGPTDTKRAQQ